MKESIGSQVYLFIECTFRYVAPVTTGREKWKTVGDATRQYQEENPRRIWRNINVAWKMKSICIYTYIKSIRGAMTRGQTFIFSKFHSVLFFWLTKRIAVRFHSFFPLLVRIQTFSFSYLAEIRCVVSPHFSPSVSFSNLVNLENHIDVTIGNNLGHSFIGGMGRSLTKRIESDSSLVSFPRRFDGRVTVWCNRSEYSKWFEWVGVSWATIRFVSFNVGRNLGEIGAQDFMLRLHEIHHPSIRALYLPFHRWDIKDIKEM